MAACHAELAAVDEGRVSTVYPALAQADPSLFGIAVMIPIILGYTGYAYWVFRGKVNASGGYH